LSSRLLIKQSSHPTFGGSGGTGVSPPAPPLLSLLFIHINLELMSWPDDIPSFPESAPFALSSSACASVARAPRPDVVDAPISFPLNPLRFTLILLHLIFFTVTLLYSDLS
jgi:hypothetical protein